MTTIKANGHKIELSNPNKVIFPDEKLTKKDLVEYYRKISGYILPFLEDRPMMLHRYPNGINGKDFYQKEEPAYFPDWIDTIKVKVKKEEQETQEFVNCNSEATLLYCANQASITPHAWLSKKDKIRNPDKLIYDLDPPKDKFELAKECAKDFREIFNELHLNAYLMTTGSKGLHIVLPLDRVWDFEKVRDYAKKMARILADSKPGKYTLETRKNKRKGRLFLDYLRNSHGQTAVVPYALRARKGAPVATPIGWDELSRVDDSKKYNAANIFRRLGRIEDPWKNFFENPNSLEEAIDKIKKL
jgi:bifunctional non-homologous end joining protein LigD